MHGDGGGDGPLFETGELEKTPDGTQEMEGAQGEGGDAGVHFLVVWISETALGDDVEDEDWHGDGDGDDMDPAVAKGFPDGEPARRDEIVKVEETPWEQDD